MIHLDGESLTIAAFARRCVQRKMSNAQARAALGDTAVDLHGLDGAMSDARRVARGGALLENKSWTDARVARLRELWAEGLSASQVAAEIGGGITRCAVIGKVHRLGIEARAKVAAHQAQRIVKPKAARTREAPRVVVDAMAREFDRRKPVADRAEPYPESAGVSGGDAARAAAARSLEPQIGSLVELHEGQCKWPSGDAAFRFCGRPAEVGKPYCAEHGFLAASEDARRARKKQPLRDKGTSGYATARRLSCAESYRW